MRIRFKGSLVDHVAFERVRVQIERVIRGKVHFNGAAEIFHDVNAAAQKTAVEARKDPWSLSSAGLWSYLVFADFPG